MVGAKLHNVQSTSLHTLCCGWNWSGMTVGLGERIKFDSCVMQRIHMHIVPCTVYSYTTAASVL